jgi:hypothetical protein
VQEKIIKNSRDVIVGAFFLYIFSLFLCNSKPVSSLSSSLLLCKMGLLMPALYDVEQNATFVTSYCSQHTEILSEGWIISLSAVAGDTYLVQI